MNLFNPQGTADVYMRALQERIRQANQPLPLESAIDKTGVIVAQKRLSDFMALPEDQKNMTQNKSMGIHAALSLGMDPSRLFAQRVDPITLEKVRQQGRVELVDTKEAALAKRPPKASNFSPEAVDAWVAKIKSNKAILSDIPGGMSANSLRAQVAAKLGTDTNYDVGKAAIGRSAGVAGASAGARLTEGGAAQMTARTANAANQQLDILADISKKFPRSDIQAFNTPIIALDKQKYPEAQNWIFAVNSFRNEYASALMRGHMPQEQAQHEVAKAIPDNITQAQLESLIPLARRELEALVSGQMTPAEGPSKPRKDPMGLFR